MGDALKESLAALGAANGRLSQIDDKISAAIQRLEAMLRERIAVRIAIVVRLANEDEMLLAFRKLDGRWCLALEGRGNAAPLLSAPRHIRAEVIVEGYVEMLIRSAPDQLDKMIEERESAVASAHGLVDALEKSAPAARKEQRRG